MRTHIQNFHRRNVWTFKDSIVMLAGLAVFVLIAALGAASQGV